MKSGHRLKDIFFRYRDEKDNLTPQWVAAFLEGHAVDRTLLKETFDKDDFTPSTPWDLLEKWRKLLILQLLSDGAGIEEQTILKNAVLKLSSIPAWREFQLLAALENLNRHLAGLPIKHAPIVQLESGAVPLEYGAHWTWGEIPHPRFHAELGVIWCMLGHLTKDNQYLEAAARLANWQINTLSYDFHPFEALFVQEQDASLHSLLMWNYLLFHAAALLASQTHLETPARKQIEFLTENLAQSCWNIPSIGLVLEHWLDKIEEAPHPPKLCLSSYIYDPHSNLVGSRSPTLNVVCSLYGGRTGLGSVKSLDVHVVNYGPQQLPLGDCLSFGIEGGPLTQKKPPVSLSPEGTFQLKRCARLASPTKNKDSHLHFRNGAHSEMWMDAQQSFVGEKLTIETSFCGYKSCDMLAFVFFVKASSCSLENKRILTPRTFDRYSGQAGLVILQGTKTNLALEALQPTGNMQIIPLAGGDNFWGADFLVAYELLSSRRDYSWRIRSC